MSKAGGSHRYSGSTGTSVPLTAPGRPISVASGRGVKRRCEAAMRDLGSNRKQSVGSSVFGLSALWLAAVSAHSDGSARTGF
jgi:hypothetical protein